MSTPIFQAFEKSLKSRPEGISPYTVRGYLRDLNKFAAWFESTNGEPMRLRDVTPIDVRDYKAHLQTVKKYKPSTINRRLAALRSYFSWAIDEGLLAEDPVRVRNVEEPQTAPRSIHEREYHRLLRAAQKDGSKRDVAIIQILRHSGLRVGELCALELGDVQMSERKGKVIVQSGKGQRYREVPLNLDARRALEEYLSEERLNVDDGHIFIGQRGNALTESAVQDVVRKYGELAKLDGVTPHVLRHTFAKSLIDKGVDLVSVKHLMGHKRLDSTARYTKPSKRDLEIAVARLELEEL
jgi:site-specific recombinase XerD